mmetsp:Transcript_59101/g.157284  ORF Transcript_59101/g.157284 Transcript_59101/m.157284 type:complete len:206 (-) Transcript_59101:399-1016(-)
MRKLLQHSRTRWRWSAAAVPDTHGPVPSRRGYQIFFEEAHIQTHDKLRVVVEVLHDLAHGEIPDVHAHVVGTRDDLILIVRMCLHTPHGQLVAVQHLKRTSTVSEVEHPQGLVDAACHEHELIILVPVHCENLMLMCWNALHRSVSVDVQDVEHGIASDTSQARGSGGRPDRGIGNVAVRHEGTHAHATVDVPHLHRVVPRSRGY